MLDFQPQLFCFSFIIADIRTDFKMIPARILILCGKMLDMREEYPYNNICIHIYPITT